MTQENAPVFTAGGDPSIVPTNLQYKDSLFRMVFNDKETLLSLYNALNNTSYRDANQLEIVTLDNAIYMNIKNDLAFIFMDYISLYGHQSTINPNLPLRGLFYIASEYEKFVQTKSRSLYGTGLVKIPTPKFVVFYNGQEPQPERQIQKLSNAYLHPEKEYDLELNVTILNINFGHNRELMLQCQSLQEYMIYIDKVRKYSETMEIRSAVNRAVNECINEDVLKEFLLKNKSEAIRMSIFEYDAEREMRCLRLEIQRELRDEVEREVRDEIAKEVRELVVKEFKESFRLETEELRIQIEKEVRDEISRVEQDKQALSIAKMMLNEQEPIEKIIRYSGLNEEQILKLKN